MKYSIIILAAGLGTRFKKKTSTKPKGLLKINNKEILLWQLENILNSKISIKDFHIVTGHCSNLIKKFYEKKLKKFKINFYHNKFYKNTGCIYSFFRTLPKLKSNFIYFNSDLVVADKYLSLISENKNSNIILCRKKINLKSTVLQDVIIYKNKIINMGLKLKDDTPYEAVGPIKCSKKIIKSIKKIKRSKRGSFFKKMPCYSFFGMYPKILNLKSIFIPDKYWHEFNTANDLKNAKNKFLFKSA